MQPLSNRLAHRSTSILRNYFSHCHSSNLLFHNRCVLSSPSEHVKTCYPNKIIELKVLKLFFSTGNYYTVTSGKLYEKQQRKKAARKKRALELANRKATGQRKLSENELQTISGNPRKALRMQNLELPEYHNVQRNRFNRIIEPTTQFRITITTSKNNVWVAVQAVRFRPGEEYHLNRICRTLFLSHAGNIGIRKKKQQASSTAFAIGLQIGQKSKRLGIKWVDVVFRHSSRVKKVLKGLEENLKIKSIVHIPRVAKTKMEKVRKRRRV